MNPKTLAALLALLAPVPALCHPHHPLRPAPSPTPPSLTARNKDPANPPPNAYNAWFEISPIHPPPLGDGTNPTPTPPAFLAKQREQQRQRQRAKHAQHNHHTQPSTNSPVSPPTARAESKHSPKKASDSPPPSEPHKEIPSHGSYEETVNGQRRKFHDGVLRKVKLANDGGKVKYDKNGNVEKNKDDEKERKDKEKGGIIFGGTKHKGPNDRKIKDELDVVGGAHEDYKTKGNKEQEKKDQINNAQKKGETATSHEKRGHHGGWFDHFDKTEQDHENSSHQSDGGMPVSSHF